MLKNYLKTAWRNLRRNKSSSVINLAGLSIGIACALFIVIFIQNELRYDKFHKDSKRIFQVIINGKMNSQEFWNGNVAPPVGAALTSNIPEIETYTRFYKPNDMVMSYEENGVTQKSFTEKDVLAVDSNFLSFFSFDVLEGDASTALMKPGSIVITESVAKKYFGSATALGKTLLINQDKKPAQVTAVIKNIPSQSSVQFDMLAPVADFPVVKQFSWSWVWRLMICYVKLKDNVPVSKTSLKEIESKFPAVVRVQAANGFRRIGKPFDEFIRGGGKWDFHLFPMTDIHLRSADIAIPWLSRISNIKYVYIFGSIAILIILLACVNFMNLATARAASRAKEVGIRKVAGSTKAQLVKQFISEAFLYSIFSSILAVIIVASLLKLFSGVVDEPIHFRDAFTANVWIALTFVTFCVGLLAGSYPAFFLTSFKPAVVLKGNKIFGSGRASLWIRNSLVVFQFTISIFMIIGTLVILKQLKFFRNTDLGFSKENVIVISGTNRLKESEESFRQTISQLPGIVSVGISSGIPSGSAFGDSYQPEPESQQTSKEVNLFSFMVNEEFIPALDIKVIRGRNFSREFNDSASIILNEEAVSQIGWKDPLGKWIDYPGNNNTRFRVVGIVKNFNVQSLRAGMSSFALFHLSSKTYGLGRSYMAVKVKSDNLSETVGKLQSTWKGFLGAEPFDYNFLDTQFDAQYRTEQRLGIIFTLFAIISIFIACLGLFGLCAYVAERRRKEIGIRKVMGASTNGIVRLLSKDFLKLVIIACMIAVPLGWYFTSKWLEDFAYRISIGWQVFFAAGIGAIVIALITVSFQAIKAAIANPVKNIRSDM
jgi:putative ABC transport system permease protein